LANVKVAYNNIQDWLRPVSKNAAMDMVFKVIMFFNIIWLLYYYDYHVIMITLFIIIIFYDYCVIKITIIKIIDLVNMVIVANITIWLLWFTWI
jgi:hypothetical protein